MLDNKNKKAAMFGLDARIALAIFGALSVITGAALYSAISNAKATALLAQMNEVGKAVEQYYLDTGVLPNHADTDSAANGYYFLETQNLVTDSGIKGWKGPYLSYKPSGDALLNPQYYNIGIFLLTNDETWGDTTSWYGGGQCLSSKKCHLSIQFTGFDDDSIAKIIDKKIDNSDGGESGNFRWWNNADANLKYRYHLAYMPLKNPHD